jgi:hypothetical protein
VETTMSDNFDRSLNNCVASHIADCTRVRSLLPNAPDPEGGRNELMLKPMFSTVSSRYPDNR